MSYWDEDRSWRSPLGTLVIGVAVGVLLTGIAWFTLSPVDGGSGPSPGGVPTADTQAFRTRGGPPRLPSGPLTSCREVFAAQDEPLGKVSAPMSQWQVHIGAMNKLVVGAITLQQATQFWNRTRVGARHRLAAFAVADQHFQQRLARCPSVVSGKAGPQLRRCTAAVAARNHALHSARRALATWRMHIRHMDMLRSGAMTPTQATQMWLRLWHRGQAQVDAYRSDADLARGKSC